MTLRLPIPYHKVSRLILPCCLLVGATTIFLCGLVRTFHIVEVETKTITERRWIKAENDYMEWWVGLPLMGSAVLALCAVLLDKPILFKLSVLAIGTCFVLLLFALLLDAGEYSWHASEMNHVTTLKADGYKCKTEIQKHNISGVIYKFIECMCKQGDAQSYDRYFYTSCEIIRSTYYLYVILGFAICCTIGLSLFTLFSFVLILKRISQITTALHLDEKPLSEDFADLHGDLYVDS